MAHNKGYSGWFKREQHAGDRLPYKHHLDDETLLLRDGSLMQTLYLEGLPFETADSDELNHRQAMRDAGLRSLSDSRFVVYHHIIRRRVKAELSSTYDNPVAAFINERWKDTLTQRDMFVNDLFVTLLYRPAEGKTGWVERIRRRVNGKNKSDRVESDKRALNAGTKALSATLEAYKPRLLKRHSLDNQSFSEPLEFLSALYNGDMRPVINPQDEQSDAGYYIPYKRASFGLEAIELRGASSADSWVAGLLSLKEYPPHTVPGMLDPLLRLPHELVITESFSFVDRQIATERMALAARRLKATDDDGHSLRNSLMEAKDSVAAGKAGFGEHHLSVLVKAPDLETLDQAIADSAAILADTGAITVREDINLEPAFWGQFPGNKSYVSRRALISTGNFAGFASLHGFPLGCIQGNHWGEALTLFETSASTPYFFNFHRGDLGHFTIIGPSGSGKTVVMNFLAAQAQKAGPRTIFFDKDRGAEIFLRALGGEYADLRVGKPSGFNPLRIVDTPAARAFLCSFIGLLVTPENGRLSVEDEKIISTAVKANFTAPKHYRQLRHFSELLAGHSRPEAEDLATRLAPWHSGGEHAWLFDNPEDCLNTACPTLGFDMTELLDSASIRTPAMMYLFQRIDDMLDGSPTMILIDEGWKILDDPVFAARLKDWMKTLRKRNAIVGFGTQSARDALDSRLSRTITEQAATQIFLPNLKAQAADYCEGFGLSTHELNLIKNIPVESRGFLIKHGAESVVARLDLGNMPDLLTLLSGREETLRQLDRLRNKYGDNPAAWWPNLIGTEWPEEERLYPYSLEAAE